MNSSRRRCVRMLARMACAGMAAWSSGAWAGGPYGSIQVGNWKGGANTDDRSGEFTHCAALAGYKGGIFVMVSIDLLGTWSLGMMHRSWRLQVGETIPISLTFDSRSQFHVFGNPIHPDIVVVPMPVDSALINAFRKAHLMTAFAKGQLLTFELTSTSQLLPALATCVRQAKSGTQLSEIRIRGGASPAPSQQAQPAPAPPPARTATSLTSSGEPPQAPALSPEMRIEAIELASNFILGSRLQNPKVLPRAETPAEFASFGAAWKSDEAFGFVKIIAPKGNVKGLDVAAAVAGADSKECKGKFASGRVSELVDSDVVFRGFATCEDSDGSRVAQYFILPRRKGGFVLFSVVSTMGSEPARTVVRDERLTDFRKAALTAVTQ
jgi:hypothetical protein